MAPVFVEAWRDSDYVSYNGHAGYGTNIRNLVEWAGIDQSDRYRVFYANGCWTYQYWAESGEDSLLDVVANIRPSYFVLMARQNIIVLEGLVSQTQSYQDILDKVDQDRGINRNEEYNPHMIISGEDNNRFRP